MTVQARRDMLRWVYACFILSLSIIDSQRSELCVHEYEVFHHSIQLDQTQMKYNLFYFDIRFDIYLKVNYIYHESKLERITIYEFNRKQSTT